MGGGGLPSYISSWDLCIARNKKLANLHTRTHTYISICTYACVHTYVYVCMQVLITCVHVCISVNIIESVYLVGGDGYLGIVKLPSFFLCVGLF